MVDEKTGKPTGLIIRTIESGYTEKELSRLEDREIKAGRYKKVPV